MVVLTHMSQSFIGRLVIDGLPPVPSKVLFGDHAESPFVTSQDRASNSYRRGPGRLPEACVEISEPDAEIVIQSHHVGYSSSELFFPR